MCLFLFCHKSPAQGLLAIVCAAAANIYRWSIALFIAVIFAIHRSTLDSQVFIGVLVTAGHITGGGASVLYKVLAAGLFIFVSAVAFHFNDGTAAAVVTVVGAIGYITRYIWHS
jgi:hypothetical protein